MKKNLLLTIMLTGLLLTACGSSTESSSFSSEEPSSSEQKDPYVVLFQQNQIPDRIFKYVYGDQFSNIHYVSSAQDAARVGLTGKNEADNNAKVDYVLLPQPALTNVLANSTANAKLYKNVQDDFIEKSGGLEITQASIFVNTNTNSALIDTFLDTIKRDIEAAVEQPSLLKEAVSGLSQIELTNKFGVGTPELLAKMVKDNAIRIGYKEAKTNKPAVDNFLKALKFTTNDTDAGLYYEKQSVGMYATDISSLKIISPSGAPAFSLYKMFTSENVEINSDANNVLTYLSANSDKDIVIAPTNALVAKVMKEQVTNFKIAANITFGNFYLASVNQ